MEGNIAIQQQIIYSEDDSLDSYYDQFIPDEYPGDDFEDSGEEVDNDFYPYEDQSFEEEEYERETLDLQEQAHNERYPEDYYKAIKKW